MDILLAGLVGWLLGGLLKIVVIRLPREHGFGGPPRCTRCGQRLAWWQLLPVIGWMAQGGRARCCGRRLDAIYPIVDAVTILIMILLYQRYGLSIDFFYLTIVAAVLVITGAIDWQYRLIYTLPTIGATLLVAAVAFAVPHHSLLNAILGLFTAGVLFVVFYLTARVMFPTQRAPFGLGDVYLGLFLGAAVGLTNLLGVMLYGMLLAGAFAAVLVVLRRGMKRSAPQYISYGTFLCIGALLYLLIWGLAGAGSAV